MARVGPAQLRAWKVWEGELKERTVGVPAVTVVEVDAGPVDLGGDTSITCAPTDHKPVEPSVGYRFDPAGRA